MRILGFAGVILAVAMGCSTAPDGDSESPSTVLDEVLSTQIICPSRWFCDDNGTYYTLKAACDQACRPTACPRVFFCDGNCHCPQ
ncbi:hypothetical protein LZC95_20700 [Pendulispora brunnea]|uniref:Uncharacterized protein n=1 Tax=Pendulispora brunnea TaxID=2905690 RepID=A0ABZ2KQA5_9BACT